MQFNMFEALLRGYLSTASDFLTEEERKHPPFAGKLVTLEIGIRFLTDFLEGNVYFKTHREGHNLGRCRTQFKLVESIEEQVALEEAAPVGVKKTLFQHKCNCLRRQSGGAEA